MRLRLSAPAHETNGGWRQLRCIIGASELERGMAEVRGRLSDGSTGRGGAMGSSQLSSRVLLLEDWTNLVRE
jgi:hypothetical protein